MGPKSSERRAARRLLVKFVIVSRRETCGENQSERERGRREETEVRGMRREHNKKVHIFDFCLCVHTVASPVANCNTAMRAHGR